MTTLTIDQLFTPETGAQHEADLLTDAASMGLKTTAWQPGDPVRTIIAVMANTFAFEDGQISLMAQGAFLDFAASGVVTFTDQFGNTVVQKVTPDPSIPGENPNGTPGWLDLLSHSVYNQTRIGAQFASGPEAIVNTTSNTYGPFAVGTYHVTNPANSAGYANANSLTIVPSLAAGGAITAATNTSPIAITTSGAHGLLGGETMFITGANGNAAANGFWSIIVTSTTTFSLVNSTGSGTWTSGGVAYTCQSALFQADLAGPLGTAGPGAISQPVTVLSGVSVRNQGSFLGADWESNLNLAARCRLSIQALSPNGPRGAYQYFARTANVFLAAQTPPVPLSSPVTRVTVQSSTTTGVVTVVVANAAGAVAGISNLGIVSASNTTPITITTGVPHTLNSGDYVTISYVFGNTNANGTRQITVTGANTFTLVGTFGNGAHTPNTGIIEGGDLGQIDTVIQANAVPDNTTAFTVSATAFPVAIQAAVEVPSAKTSVYLAAAQTALAVYFSALPIGGISGAIQYNDIIGVLYTAGIVGTQPSYVSRITTLTLNGLTTDLPYISTLAVAQLSPTPVVNVTGV